MGGRVQDGGRIPSNNWEAPQETQREEKVHESEHANIMDELFAMMRKILPEFWSVNSIISV